MKKFAFIKLRKNHVVLETFKRLFQETFSDYEMVQIDIRPELERNIHWCIFNLYHIYKTYGLKGLTSGWKRFYAAFYGTPYIFDKISRIIQKIVPKDIAFSIQEGSMYNAKTDGVHNFIYTDNTARESMRTNYGMYNESLFHTDWLARERQIYDNASITFTRSTNVSNSVSSDYGIPENKVQCIYFTPPILNKDDIKPEKYGSKTILFIGMEWERKGGETLYKAFKQCVAKHPDAKLVIIGCIPDINDENVEILGLLPTQEVAPWYNKASIFCMPSKWEPFGNVCIEAMASGLPLVLSNISALPDFVEHDVNGFMIPPEDEAMLAEYLSALLGDAALCERMGEESHRLYKERYTLDSVSKALREAVLSTVGNDG